MSRRLTRCFRQQRPRLHVHRGNGYTQQDTLWNRVGYWLKFPTAQTVDITGMRRVQDTIDVQEGWNMIGRSPLQCRRLPLSRYGEHRYVELLPVLDDRIRIKRGY